MESIIVALAAGVIALVFAAIIAYGESSAPTAAMRP